MFSRSAHLYDLIYDAVVDYDTRCEEMHEAIRARNPHARTLLEVGCGTGRNLERLRAHYDVAGMDIEPDMLAIAAQRLPGVPLVQADMVAFDLGRRFDAVICPFSSIGYVRTLAAMHAAVDSMARHLAADGVLLFDGWVELGQWRPGRTFVHTGGDGETTVARMSRSDLTPGDPSVSVLELEFLVGTAERIEHFGEHHELGLFTRSDYIEACSDAGLRQVRACDSPLGSGRSRIIASAG